MNKLTSDDFSKFSKLYKTQHSPPPIKNLEMNLNQMRGGGVSVSSVCVCGWGEGECNVSLYCAQTPAFEKILVIVRC